MAFGNRQNIELCMLWEDSMIVNQAAAIGRNGAYPLYRCTLIGPEFKTPEASGVYLRVKVNFQGSDYH